MTVGEREILFAAESKDTDRLIGRVLAGRFTNINPSYIF